jgi:hypothetical protein
MGPRAVTEAGVTALAAAKLAWPARPHMPTPVRCAVQLTLVHRKKDPGSRGY